MTKQLLREYCYYQMKEEFRKDNQDDQFAAAGGFLLIAEGIIMIKTT